MADQSKVFGIDNSRPSFGVGQAMKQVPLMNLAQMFTTKTKTTIKTV